MNDALMILINQVITYGYYAMTLLFACACLELQNPRSAVRPSPTCRDLTPFCPALLHTR